MYVAALVLVGCGSSVVAPSRPAPQPVEPSDVATASAGDAPEERALDSRPEERAAEEVAPDEEIEPGEPPAIEPAPAGTPCFTDATDHVVGPPRQDFGHGFLVTLRTSAQVRGDEIHARPGETVRLELALEPEGTTVLMPDARLRAAMSRLDVMGAMGAGAAWTIPVRTEPALRGGRRIARGGVLRLCAVFEVGDAPLDAAPPSQGGERAYTVSWTSPVRESGAVQPLSNDIIVVHYPPDSGPVRREAESWGGVIAVQVREGADLAQIARETGVRLGTGVRLFERMRDVEPASAQHVQAPPDLSVRDATARLLARPDVERATPLMRGDPGTEGCSEHSPCGQGESCCYMCGIAGCPNSCYAGIGCPMGIP